MDNWQAAKWVRVMCDFSAEGLWAKDGCGVGADDLPVSAPVKARLASWQDWYERDCQDYLPDDERERELDRDAFSTEGLNIARAIKAELPDWTVIYFDEEKAAATRDDTARDRSKFEYEILLTAQPGNPHDPLS